MNNYCVGKKCIKLSVTKNPLLTVSANHKSRTVMVEGFELDKNVEYSLFKKNRIEIRNLINFENDEFDSEEKYNYSLVHSLPWKRKELFVYNSVTGKAFGNPKLISKSKQLESGNNVNTRSVLKELQNESMSNKNRKMKTVNKSRKHHHYQTAHVDEDNVNDERLNTSQLECINIEEDCMINAVIPSKGNRMSNYKSGSIRSDKKKNILNRNEEYTLTESDWNSSSYSASEDEEMLETASTKFSISELIMSNYENNVVHKKRKKRKRKRNGNRQHCDIIKEDKMHSEENFEMLIEPDLQFDIVSDVLPCMVIDVDNDYLNLDIENLMMKYECWLGGRKPEIIMFNLWNGENDENDKCCFVSIMKDDETEIKRASTSIKITVNCEDNGNMSVLLWDNLQTSYKRLSTVFEQLELLYQSLDMKDDDKEVLRSDDESRLNKKFMTLAETKSSNIFITKELQNDDKEISHLILYNGQEEWKKYSITNCDAVVRKECLQRWGCSVDESYGAMSDCENLNDDDDDMRCTVCWDTASECRQQQRPISVGRNCGHAVCEGCLIDHAKSVLEGGHSTNCITCCPAFDCEEVLSVACILSTASVSARRYLKRKMTSGLLINNAISNWTNKKKAGVYGLRCGKCNAILLWKDDCAVTAEYGFNGKWMFVCCYCDKTRINIGINMCGLCGQQSHWPCSCSEVSKHRTRMMMLGDANITVERPQVCIVKGRPCPSCNFFATKDSGTNDVVCQCRSRFCWLCGRLDRQHKKSIFPCTGQATSLITHDLSYNPIIISPSSIRSRYYCVSVKLHFERQYKHLYSNFTLPLSTVISKNPALSPYEKRAVSKWISEVYEKLITFEELVYTRMCQLNKKRQRINMDFLTTVVNPIHLLRMSMMNLKDTLFDLCQQQQHVTPHKVRSGRLLTCDTNTEVMFRNNWDKLYNLSKDATSKLEKINSLSVL